MKKFTSFVFVLFVGLAVNAQLVCSPLVTDNLLKTTVARTDAATPNIPDETVPVGYCSFLIENLGGIGAGDDINLSAAVQLPASMFEGKGNKIFAVRFALASEKVTDVKVFLTKDLAGEPARVQVVEQPNKGWNYIIFDTPYELDTEDIYLGYSLHTSAYALGTESATKTNIKADFVAINGEWTNLSKQGIKALNAIQAMAVGGDYADYQDQEKNDAAISYFNMKKYVHKNEDLDIKLTVSNYGVQTLKSFDVAYRIGKGEEQTIKVENVAVPNGASYVVDMPQNALSELGKDTIVVEVRNINGDTPDGDLRNNTVSVGVECLDKFFARKTLLELFTGQGCGYCPAGHDVAEGAVEGIEDRVIWVAHHAGYNPDIFTVPEDSKYVNFFKVSGAPNCMIDRTVSLSKVPDSSGRMDYRLVFHPGYTSREMFDQYLEIPSFATITLSGTYDNDSRALEVTVSGEVVKDLPNAKLNVFITQSGYKAQQAGSNLGKNYVHNDFMRESLTGDFGEDLVLGDDGSYSKTYTYSIPEKIETVPCDPYQMTVVAFIADYKSTDRNSCKVQNVEKLDLSEIGAISSIENVETGKDVYAYVSGGRICVEGVYERIEVYTVDGKAVENANLADGIYVVKVSSLNQLFIKKVIVR